MSSSFWGGITGGRLLAVPLAVRFSTDSLMKANLVGCLLSSAALLVAGQVSVLMYFAAPCGYHACTLVCFMKVTRAIIFFPLSSLLGFVIGHVSPCYFDRRVPQMCTLQEESLDRNGYRTLSES